MSICYDTGAQKPSMFSQHLISHEKAISQLSNLCLQPIYTGRA